MDLFLAHIKKESRDKIILRDFLKVFLKDRGKVLLPTIPSQLEIQQSRYILCAVPIPWSS